MTQKPVVLKAHLLLPPPLFPSRPAFLFKVNLNHCITMEGGRCQHSTWVLKRKLICGMLRKRDLDLFKSASQSALVQSFPDQLMAVPSLQLLQWKNLESFLTTLFASHPISSLSGSDVGLTFKIYLESDHLSPLQLPPCFLD